MKYSLVHADYDFNTNDINLHCRDENGKKIRKIVCGFPPYGYAPIDKKDVILSHKEVTNVEEVDIPHIDNKKVIRFETKRPKNVGDIRDEYKDFFQVFEANIPFARRMMIDTGLLCGFECDEDTEILRPSEIKPCEYVQQPRKAFFDIENSIERKFLTINCIYDHKSGNYISLALDPKGERSESMRYAKNWRVFIFPTELELIEATKKVFKKINPDIITAWNVSYDIDYINDRSIENGKKEIDYSYANVFDMCKPYKKLYNKGSGKLKDVVHAEELDVPGYEPFQQRYWEQDLEKAIRVNKTHVESIVKLDEKLEILDTYWNYKSIGGFEDMSPTVYHGSIVDNRILRKYHGHHVFDSRPSKEVMRQRKIEMKKIQMVGGKVFEPPFGRFSDISFYDMSRYYPELIIAQNLTFEECEPGKMGLLPEMVLELIEERLKYDRRLDKIEPGTDEHKQMKFLRDSIKFVLNSIFGYCGWEGARAFRLDIFNKITTKGQEGLGFVRDKGKIDGKDLIYGDTDSTALIMLDNEKSMELVKDETLVKKLLEDGMDENHVYTVAHAIEYTDTLNGYLKEFSKINGFQRDLELKLDRYFSKILFKKVRERVDGKWVERGAKKRYVGWVLWEKKPVKYLKIVGF